MSEKLNIPESPKQNSFLKAMLLSGGIVALGSMNESAQAQEKHGQQVLSHSLLSIEQVETLPFNPLVLQYADTFYSIETSPDIYLPGIFEELQELDITGKERKAIIDGDGIVMIVNSFKQFTEGECRWMADDSTMPIIFYSKTPEICEFEAFYFPSIELLS